MLINLMSDASATSYYYLDLVLNNCSLYYALK